MNWQLGFAQRRKIKIKTGIQVINTPRRVGQRYSLWAFGHVTYIVNLVEGNLNERGRKACRSLSLIAFMAEWMLSCCEVFENLNFTEVSFIFSIHIWWLECKTSQHRVMNTVRTKKRSSGEVLSHYKVEIMYCQMQCFCEARKRLWTLQRFFLSFIL